MVAQKIEKRFVRFYHISLSKALHKKIEYMTLLVMLQSNSKTLLCTETVILKRGICRGHNG